MYKFITMIETSNLRHNFVNMIIGSFLASKIEAIEVMQKKTMNKNVRN